MRSYAVLGVAPDATDDDVRRAYKHKALECHPDRHVKDKDIATRDFIELNTAYHAILSERARKAAMSRASELKSAEQHAGTKNDPTPPKAPSSSSSSSTRSSFPTSSTPSSTPSSSPFTTPSSSPYSTPASSPASSTTSLPDDKDSSPPKTSATCEDEDEDDHSSTTCGSSTSHTTKPPPDPGSSAGATPTTPKPPRAKLRKQPPKAKSNSSTSSSPTSSHDYKCRGSHTRPTYTASSAKSKSSATCDTHSDTASNTHSHSSKHPKVAEIELKEYFNSFPSLNDYPRVDLAPEWVYPLQLTLEDIFRGKRLCYRIRRRYLSGKTKAVVLDVDIPAGCRSGTKIVFRDAGHERRDGTRQDLVFVVRGVKHVMFVRGCEWDGGGGNGRDAGKDDKDDQERRRDSDHSNKGCGSKTRKSHEYGEDDLVMEVRLPWVDRLKEEIAKVVVSGVDGKELVFEVDCRSGKYGSSREKERGKMTGIYIVEGAGMPVRSDIRSASGGGSGKGADVGANGSAQRGRLIIRWEIFVPASSSSTWESFKQMFKFGK